MGYSFFPRHYLWRSGYWSAPRTDWVYVPATYIWTPRGYLFVDGYWDYAILRRGVVFAPVYFHRPVYAVAGYRHTPRLVISLSVFTDHLFLRPSYRHYYFGDYYAPAYRTRGYYVSSQYHNTRRGYDPVFAYNSWSHRNDRNWERNHRIRYEHLRDRESARPPRTWTAMQSCPEYREPSRALASPIDQYARNRTAADSQRFRNVDQPSRERIVAQTRQVRNFGNERQRTEGRVARGTQSPDRATNVERSRSPITSRERAARPDTDRGRADARTPNRTAPPAAGRPAREQERATKPPSARPNPAQRETTRPERVRPEERETDTRRAVPQARRTEETRPAQRPQRAQPQQRPQPTPQRAQPQQRPQPTPQSQPGRSRNTEEPGNRRGR